MKSSHHLSNSDDYLIKRSQKTLKNAIKQTFCHPNADLPTLNRQMGLDGFGDRPHPGLLPRGEGETLAAFWREPATGLVQPFSQIKKRAR